MVFAAELPKEVPETAPQPNWELLDVIESREYIENLIELYGADLDVEERKEILNVIKCESGFNQNAVGDYGNSYGAVQIHLPSWDITKEQALDLNFSIKFITDKWREGSKHLWTCYRLLYAPATGPGYDPLDPPEEPDDE